MVEGPQAGTDSASLCLLLGGCRRYSTLFLGITSVDVELRSQEETCQDCQRVRCRFGPMATCG